MANQMSPVEVQAADGMLYVLVVPGTPLEDVRDMLRAGRVEVMASRGSLLGSDEESRTPDGFLTY